MSDPWYSKGYPGGPMVGPPFTRPLYPPDAIHRGKSPSEPGDDIVAVKRTVWRLGRWPGPASAFDEAFSNAFSHGKSGNVAETGLAGVQRQLNLDASGWMGEATYNGLRSARIPAGLPNAGQPGMDGTAIELLERFRQSFLGDTDTVRTAALALAKTLIGYKESPAGTNCNMFGAWYGMNYEPWCAIFVSYCFELGSAGGSPSFVKGQRFAYCPYVVDDATAKRNGLSLTNDPIPGDLVVYDWSGGVADHIGIFESGAPLGFNAIEGNTSVSNDSNGGEVMRRSRSVVDAHNVWFVRVKEPS